MYDPHPGCSSSKPFYVTRTCSSPFFFRMSIISWTTQYSSAWNAICALHSSITSKSLYLKKRNFVICTTDISPVRILDLEQQCREDFAYAILAKPAKHYFRFLSFLRNTTQNKITYGFVCCGSRCNCLFLLCRWRVTRLEAKWHLFLI